MKHFSALALSEPILRALAEEGYDIPTPIQAKAIPPALEGKDLLGCAQTGTGKTAAFALPILHRLQAMPANPSRHGQKFPRALILSPTRELASQIGQSFATYGRHTGLTHTTVYGGVSQFNQVRALHRGVDILVATPGRLLDLMQQRVVVLREVNVLVLDEADRMLDMGFIAPIRQIAAALPSPRQTLMFSATMPREITHLAESLLHHPVKVMVTPVASTVPLTEQLVYRVPRGRKPALLEHLLAEKHVTRALVFIRTKHHADRLCRMLVQRGISAVAIHGNKSQSQRERALAGFRAGHARVLVATDVAARGLDVDGITHVFNFDLPHEPEAYVHRIGRTGRAGATGIAIGFCDPDESDLLHAIEKLTGKRIPLITDLPALPEPIHKPTISPPHPSLHPPSHRAPSHQPRQHGHGHGHGGHPDHRQSSPPSRSSHHAPHQAQSHGQSAAPQHRKGGHKPHRKGGHQPRFGKFGQRRHHR